MRGSSAIQAPQQSDAGVVSRRGFIGFGVAAGLSLSARGQDRSQSQSGPAISNSSLLSEPRYADVQFPAGPLQQQFEENHLLFLNLSEDSLLKPFRQRAGLPAPGPDMGGWYDNSTDFNPHGSFHGYVPGHSFGQYVSALSRFYAATGDLQTRAKIARLVKAYGETVRADGRFYVDYHLPAYTYDKTVCGLIDAHFFAQDPLALAVLGRETDAVLPYLPGKALTRAEQKMRPHKDEAYTWDETYTLPENQFLAWRRSGDARYRDMGTRYLLDKDYFEPLSRGENVLPGRHAYSHVNALSSAMQAYLVLGDAKYLQAAQNAFRMVQEQSFATGGWGPNETFIQPGSGALGDSLRTTRASFETPCGAYGHFKVARYLLRVTRDSRYGDSMEQVLYNTVLGAKPIQPDGRSFYYSDYHIPGQKAFHRDKWPCCSGTLPQIAADYRISSYFLDARGVYVNLYVPSKLTWQQGADQYSLRQVTDYPYSENIRLELEGSRSGTFSVFLRIPQWATGARISVNGERGDFVAIPGTFADVQRQWKPGDRIELHLPLPISLQPVDAQHVNTVALVRGPLVLMASANVTAHVTRPALLAAQQAGSRVWTVKAEPAEVSFTPFTEIRDEQYTTYVTVS